MAEDNKAALKSWNIIEFDQMKMIIYLEFDNPIDVSSGPVKD